MHIQTFTNGRPRITSLMWFSSEFVYVNLRMAQNVMLNIKHDTFTEVLVIRERKANVVKPILIKTF